MASLSPIASELIRGGKELERLSGNQTFTWKGKEVVCVPDTLNIGSTVIEGGFEREVTCTLYVRRSHFLTIDSTLVTIDSDLYTIDNDTPTPVAGRKLTFRGKVYRIARAGENGARSHFVLTLVDPNV